MDCMGLNRDNIPDTYHCEICEPRPVDRDGAKALQMRKRSELNIDTSETDSSDEIPDQTKPGNETGKKGTVFLFMALFLVCFFFFSFLFRFFSSCCF